MHHSRLCAFVIDCKTDDLDAATTFWSQALGRAAQPPDPQSPTYRALSAQPQEPLLLLQQVDHPGRIHLDIETDNQDAEVLRLEALGARRVAFVKRWWVMEAPSGQRFCVVNPQRGPLDATNANVWP
ncbi:VOC family protein [Cystobacter fuscus]|uniref:VOC family protein n=1 Tax=Cystobacter fuscus TaxID=43 RepID=UPI002B2ABACF|nr:VOC family protein [Cystobacter fuscus]